MMTFESTLSLIAACSMALLLANSYAPQAQNSLYGVMLANDFAESMVKSPDMLASLSDYFGAGDPLAIVPARQRLESAAISLPPSGSIKFCISGSQSAMPGIGGCPAEFKSSFTAERDVLIKSQGTSSMARIRFSAYFV
ncbi:MAG: hypothetical protein WC506_02535 [Candidatus Micrarchaeia archaeon]